MTIHTTDRPGRRTLPQLEGPAFLTDAGLETWLVFHHGWELPGFAAYPLVLEERGRALLTDYFTSFLQTADDVGTGVVLETPTWRANADWGATLGHGPEVLTEANTRSVELLRELAASAPVPTVVSGNLGPRGDGYRIDRRMTEDEAAGYHGVQIETLAAAGVDLVSAFTLSYVEEAIGVVAAAARAGLAVVPSFTVETDGRLASGMALAEAIERLDDATGGYAAYVGLNCAHPVHLSGALTGATTERVRALRANASVLSHAELDEATELDDGDPDDLARRYVGLRTTLPGLAVLGGCCGTDHRHVEAIARHWFA